MVDNLTNSRRNVVDFSSYQDLRRDSARALVAKALAVTARTCRHCGAALMEGESEEECSGALTLDAAPQARFRATPER